MRLLLLLLLLLMLLMLLMVMLLPAPPPPLKTMKTAAPLRIPLRKTPWLLSPVPVAVPVAAGNIGGAADCSSDRRSPAPLRQPAAQRRRNPLHRSRKTGTYTGTHSVISIGNCARLMRTRPSTVCFHIIRNLETMHD